jgi:hypothetical protein
MKITRRKIESKKSIKTKKNKKLPKSREISKSRKMRGGDTVEYPEGVYDGDIRMDGDRKIRHGKGKMTYNEDNEDNEDYLIEYDGDWVDDKIQGNGTMIYDEDHHPDGYSEYTGEWMNGLPHGKGQMSFSHETSEYDGDWVNGKMEGTGKMTYDIDMEVNEEGVLEYNGKWKDGKKSGYGVMTYVNDRDINEEGYSEYAGNWENDQKNEEGKMTFFDGRIYDGYWENDEPNFESTNEYSGLDAYSGDWTDIIWYELDGNEIMYAREEQSENGENNRDEFNTPIRTNHARTPSPINNNDTPPRNVAIRRRNPRRFDFEDDAYDENVFQIRPENFNLMDRFEFNDEDNEGVNVPFEVHRAAGKINLEKYLEIIGIESGASNYKNISEYVKSKFIPYINESFIEGRMMAIEKLNKILARLSSAAELSETNANIKLVGNTVDFVFKQSKEFIDFYIRTFIQDCYHAYNYEGEAGMSCVAGILERFYMIVGDAVFAMCPDGACENKQYIELLKLFNKHIDNNELTQEWANTYLESEELKNLNPVERKMHYIKFMKEKYSNAEMLDENTERIINEEADKINYVFETLQFGGKKKKNYIKNRKIYNTLTKKIYKNKSKKYNNISIKKRKTIRRKRNKLYRTNRTNRTNKI